MSKHWKYEQSTTVAPEIYVDSCGSKGIGETPQCDSEATEKPMILKWDK